MTGPLLLSALIIATCGLIYEFIAAAQASYVLGDSITQFSLVIGVYLFSMGLGSWLAQYVRKRLLERFIDIEVMVGLVGGFSAIILFTAFSYDWPFRLVLFSLVVLTGTLVGAEIPLLLRILRAKIGFKELVSRVLALDYIGALAASLMFPLFLVPKLGLIRSALAFGALNVLVALVALAIFRHKIYAWRSRVMLAGAAFLLLVGSILEADRFTRWAENAFYNDPIILTWRSPYQRLVVTHWQDDLRLYLNGHLQFSTVDEYRYHESLVLPGLNTVANKKRVLILGGGDGLAAREVLRYPAVEKVDLVDLDPLVTKVFRDNDNLARLNHYALRNPRVSVTNDDAFIWLKKKGEIRDSARYNFAAIDFPDPTNYSLGKLYSVTFFRYLKRVLAPDALVAMQISSPFFSKKAFWCVVETARKAGFTTKPYHAYVPSFGEWGFLLLSMEPRMLELNRDFTRGLTGENRYLKPGVLDYLFTFPPDLAPVPVETNDLDNQVLVRYYEEDWARFVR